MDDQAIKLCAYLVGLDQVSARAIVSSISGVGGGVKLALMGTRWETVEIILAGGGSRRQGVYISSRWFVSSLATLRCRSVCCMAL